MLIYVFYSGLIGKSWAMVFISGGYSVCLYDIDTEQTSSAMTFIKDKLHQLEKDGLIRGSSSAEEQYSLISSTTDLKTCIRGAVHIQV